MSMYQLMSNPNPAAGRLFFAIRLDPMNVPRVRDAWIDSDFQVVTVLTRTGGGNREEYEAANAQLSSHEGYLGDHDSEFDSTYAEFRFRVSQDERESLLAEIDAADLTDEDRERLMEVITKTASQKFNETMQALTGVRR